ncbi:MAG TPA: WecB/TagA/CpsF family glycosyltransferase [Tepidisphaeraceae bacterium]|nr:WecB/TagA/CpsF family glycosyltransferase [Tepidisphaeraceae bacterium]
MGGTQISNPVRYSVFGVQVSSTCYDEVVARVMEAAASGQPGLLDFMPVHLLTEVARRQDLRAMLDDFDIVAPDGQPVRWALNYFHGAGLTDRVYGPELMRRLCAAAAQKGIPIYLYGGTEDVLARLRERLLGWFPNLSIAGAESPPFRPLTDEEHEETVGRINDSGAGIVFLGIGSPKQEIFAHRHRHDIRAVQLCVGAAFDFHAGVKKMAPPWMQKRGLEWLFRVIQEPGRLWKRYLIANSTYLALFAREIVLRRLRGLRRMFPRRVDRSPAT